MEWILGSTKEKTSAKSLSNLRWKENSSISIPMVKSLLLNKLIKRKKIVAKLSFSSLLQRSSRTTKNKELIQPLKTFKKLSVFLFIKTCQLNAVIIFSYCKAI